jgi:hypothetical protein
MSERRLTYRDVSERDLPQLVAAVGRPCVALAECVGRFDPPFQYLMNAIGGFDEQTRFVLNKVIEGDPEAIAARDWLVAVRRSQDLGERHPGMPDRWREYLCAHAAEHDQFTQKYFPWMFTRSSHEPDPETDRLLDYYICERLEAYGFTANTRRLKKTYWRCHSTLLSRRVTIEFDKGTTLPGLEMTGGIEIPDFSLAVSLAYPFCFSGNSFYTSTAHDVHAQFERFFSEFVRLFPHIWKALEEGIATANDFLATITRKSVS